MTYYMIEKKGPLARKWSFEACFKKLREGREHIKRQKFSYPRVIYRVVRLRQEKIYE